jgi:hypothetical protein
LFPIIGLLSLAMEEYRHGNQEAVMVSMERALAYTAEVCDAMEIDWRIQILKKCKKNLGRPYRHGKEAR